MRNLLSTRKTARYALAASLLFAVTCSLKLGDAPIGPTVIGPGQQDTTVTLTIRSTRTQLVADGFDTATIEVTLRDNLGHAMAGEIINFTTNNIGTVTSTGVIDQAGFCRVTLTSAKVNDTCWVRAQAENRNIWDSVSVVFSGVHLSLLANPAALRVAVDTTLITGQLFDGSNRVISNGDSVVFRTRIGRFINSDTIFRAVFNASGLATVRLFSNTFGTVIVYVSSAGINDSIAVNFNNTVPPVGSRLFTLYSSKTQLKADNYDTATITAMVMDEDHNPAAGDTIRFTCNLGMIGAYAVVDEKGDAKTWLRARPVNGTCIITATDLKTNDTASTSVLFSGVTLLLETSSTDMNTGDYATLTATIKDGSGNPISGDSIVFNTTAPGLFENSATQMKVFIDYTGRGSVRVTSNSATRISVYAFCLNTGDTTELFFTNNAITLVVSKDTILVGRTDSSLLTATYLDGSSNPVFNALVVFYANAGTITRDSVFTNASGQASTWLKSADFTGTATVMASTSAGNALAKVAFRAAVVKKIKLTISPDNISVNGGVATLTAMVWDVNDNLVNNADVNFLILAGPGGGEHIDKPMATTQNGRATARLYAGSVPSMYRSVMVAASVADTGDTSKLTISGEPYAISVSHPHEDTVPVQKAGHLNETTFDYFVGAVVCDINGNPVADGTRANFSAVVSGMAVHYKYFVRWAGLDGTDPHAVYSYYYEDVPFEDINNNYRMDENDLKLDYYNLVASRGDDVNGDGVCDFNPLVHDLWVDFNDDGGVDLNVGEDDTAVVGTVTLWADIYPNGVRDTSELIRDINGNGIYDIPASGDRLWYEFESLPYWFKEPFDFKNNDFGISINTSATTIGGVANVELTYPRQLARRLIVSVNVESNGVRDRSGARFVLPVIQ